jgi:hypothetical protein
LVWGSSGQDGDARVGTTDTSGALEFGEHVTESVVVDAESVTEVSARQRVSSAADGEEDAVVKGEPGGISGLIVPLVWWSGSGSDLQVGSGSVIPRCEPQFERLERRGRAMF